MGNNQGTTFNDQMIAEFSSLSGLSENQVGGSDQTSPGEAILKIGQRGVSGLAIPSSKWKNGEEMF